MRRMVTVNPPRDAQYLASFRAHQVFEVFPAYGFPPPDDIYLCRAMYFVCFL